VTDANRRANLQRLSTQLGQIADDIGAEIVKHAAKDAAQGSF